MRLPPHDTELFLLIRQPIVFARRYAWSLALLFIGASLDGFTTYETMSRFGPEAEVHPAQRIIMSVLGVTAGVPIAKLIQIGFVLPVAAWWRPWCGWILGGCGVLYSLAAISNHFMLF